MIVLSFGMMTIIFLKVSLYIYTCTLQNKYGSQHKYIGVNHIIIFCYNILDSLMDTLFASYHIKVKVETRS